MDVQQKANLRIYEEFGKRKIEFAYPTQTLYLTRP
jgi:small-conductance mechanosensitive channel